MTGEQTWIGWLGAHPPLVWTIAAAMAFAAVLVGWVWRKGRPFGQGDVFRASRLSSGNHVFPTQVLITPVSVVRYTPRWIGRQEETIHIAHVSSVKVDTGLLLSNLRIETSGGSDPIRCHGHHKGDANAMKQLIERYQTDYHQKGKR